MIDDPSIYIGIGMVLSLLATETLGVTAGGIIVPGYIAIHMHKIDYVEVGMNGYHMVIATFGISIITFLIIKFLSNFILIYGKRRLVLALLLGFLLGNLTNLYLENYALSSEIIVDTLVIGNIIPGLIANWMDRQGVLRTICTILITASITNLIVNVLFFGEIFI